MDRHTLGPWFIAAPFTPIIASKDEPFIAVVEPIDAKMENARLIAASPELLEIAESILALDSLNDLEDLMENIGTVVAKAKGE